MVHGHFPFKKSLARRFERFQKRSSSRVSVFMKINGAFFMSFLILRALPFLHCYYVNAHSLEPILMASSFWPALLDYTQQHFLMVFRRVHASRALLKFENDFKKIYLVQIRYFSHWKIDVFCCVTSRYLVGPNNKDKSIHKKNHSWISESLQL